jgi:hypothetical protein
VNRKSRNGLFRWIGALQLLALAVLFPLAVQAQVTITGRTTQINTLPQDQEGPYISGQPCV